VYQDLVKRLRPDARITVLTGAGVSAASGVPTFRGADGLWRNFRPEALATAEAFGRDPKLVWEWYAWRRFRIAACDPNPAHVVLAEWTRRFPNFHLITQNVDGLHDRASAFATAFTSAEAAADRSAGQAADPKIINLHGSIWEVSCWRGCANAPKRWRDETVSFSEIPPRCPHCKGPIRPGVVWFGETLDPVIVRKASAAADCDVFITVGTSAVVYPAAGFITAAKQKGAFTVEINPEATPATDAVDLPLRGPAEQILPEIAARLRDL
jgi:NAD-dependent deacetylase